MRNALVLVLTCSAAAAQPADCPIEAAPQGVLPLAIDLGGRPGVPRGLTGQAYVDLPVGNQSALECTQPAPPGPRDILHGPPGDVLHGPPPANLLRGDGQPVVRMQVLPADPPRR
ncbi:MAG: hypothetical protein AB7F35_27710 [Acetobacteraceae bacterium]